MIIIQEEETEEAPERRARQTSGVCGASYALRRRDAGELYSKRRAKTDGKNAINLDSLFS